MLKKSLKVIFFAAFVLLLGQVSLQGNTLGGHFQGVVVRGLMWGKQEIMATQAFQRLSQGSPIRRWLDKVNPPVTPTTEGNRLIKEASPDSEEFTSSDRESILRLLQ